MNYELLPLFGLLICVIMVLQYHLTKYLGAREMLNGFWQAPYAFCKRSGLDSLQCYIADSSIYILAANPEGVAVNKCVGWDLSWQPTETNDAVYCWAVEFADDVRPFPQECQLRLDTEKQMMHFIQGETIYLEAFKNPAATAGIL
jgi:hypothetical protein